MGLGRGVAGSSNLSTLAGDGITNAIPTGNFGDLRVFLERFYPKSGIRFSGMKRDETKSESISVFLGNREMLQGLLTFNAYG
jgi:hypothetical protein